MFNSRLSKKLDQQPNEMTEAEKFYDTTDRKKIDFMKMFSEDSNQSTE